MNNTDKKIRLVDVNREDTYLQLFPDGSFIQKYETGLDGLEMRHNRHPACEYPEHYIQQNAIVIHLRPELGSERRLDNCLQIENVSVGEVAIVPAYVNHWQSIVQDISEGILLFLEPHILSRLAQEIINTETVELLPTFAQPDPLIYGLALAIKKEIETSDFSCCVYVESLCHTLVVHLLRHYANHKPKLREYQNGLAPYKLKKILSYINDHLNEKLELAQMAQELDMSQYYFCRLFKKSMNITPHQYIIQQRIEKAKKLLGQHNFSIAYIAQNCNFSTQSHFTMWFRRHTGITPKAFRKQL